MFKKKLLALVLACTTVFSMVGCSSNEAKKEEAKEPETKKVLRVGVTATYNPWCYKEGEEIVGVDVDILKEVAKRMGDYEIQFEVASSDGMFGLLDAGKVDTVAQQISVTPAREEKYKFSEIYAYNPYKLSVRADDDSINSVEDLKGKRFACQPAGFEKEFIEEYKEKNDPNDEIEVVITEEQRGLVVNQNKADAHSYPVLSFDRMIEEGGLNLKQVGENLYEENNAYPFLKDCDEELYNKFNEALKSMKEDGFLTNLYNEYFGMDISESVMNK